MKGFAIHNAPTDHGGRIPATQMMSSQMGNLFVVAGDGHMCPKCKCWSTVLKSHDHVIFDGKAVAYAGDKLTCGARILPQQSHVVGDSGNYENNNSNLSDIISPNKFDDRFQIMSQTGQPISNTKYLIVKSNGEQIRGVTNSNGYTELIVTGDEAEIVSIQITNDY